MSSYPLFCFFFSSVILVPIASNAAEHGTALIVAYKNRMNLSIAVAVASAVQVALLIVRQGNEKKRQT